MSVVFVELKVDPAGVALAILDSGVARESGVFLYKWLRWEGTLVANEDLLKEDETGKASLI